MASTRNWNFGSNAYDRGCMFDAMTEDARIAAFEGETGCSFTACGPTVQICEYCDGLYQFIPEHECYGTQGARLEAVYGGHGLIEE